ncbi:unnamed protein product [Rotaria sordida]|uniref:LIM zinc-binding domain-containing protein n=1 Tax=Rotaria sordida TaxID=392033 RepID=A0A819AYM5_9BILA|nr:unnamed protein product [Rotaria sordida]
MINVPIKTNVCKKCNDCFQHEETVALFKQHQYHFHCFLCIDCKKQLSHESFYLDEKLQLDISNPQVYCETCYYKRCSSCIECNQIFTPTSIIIEFQGQEYHNECFICKKCRITLKNKIFYSKNNFLYCQQCMNDIEPCIMTLKTSQILNDQCKKCGKNFLNGEAISMYQCDYYHPDCFRCGNCKKLIVSQGFFRQEDGCLYCLNCHIDNGPHCMICKEPFLTGEILSQFDGKQFHNTCFLFIILSLTFQSLSSIPVKTQQSEGSFIQNDEEFIPTNEWQIVKEGQAIPPGLHVRLDLQTGIREAKLLEDNKQKLTSNDIIPISTNDNEKEKISKENLERAFANLDLSKDDIITDKKHEEEIKTKFRPYDDLKKDFQSMNIKIQTDNEILTNLINQLTKTNNEHDLKTILTDLEYYLHQV